tara:strand:+ start:714 stop:1373 length:660 start_codon:yes stop_codon:yes gene_type:complete
MASMLHRASSGRSTALLDAESVPAQLATLVERAAHQELKDSLKTNSKNISKGKQKKTSLIHKAFRAAGHAATIVSRNTGWAGFLAILAVLLVVITLLYDKFIDVVPSTADLYTTISRAPAHPFEGLEITDIDLQWEYQEGFSVLNVKGKIFNSSREQKIVHTIRVTLLDANDKELVHWLLEPIPNITKPGEYVDFHTSIRQPPTNIVTALIKFDTHVTD